MPEALGLSQNSEIGPGFLSIQQETEPRQLDAFIYHLRQGIKADIEHARDQLSREIGGPAVKALELNAKAFEAMSQASLAIAGATNLFQQYAKSTDEKIRQIEAEIASLREMYTLRSNVMERLNELDSEIHNLMNRKLFSYIWSEIKRVFNGK